MSASRKIDVPLLMGADEFLGWSADIDGRWELHDGHPVMMSPESTAHGSVQLAIVIACERALPNGSPSVAMQTGKAVKTGEQDFRIPDVHIDCALGEDRFESVAKEPVVLFEVGDSSLDYDLGDKRTACFKNPHVRHDVVVAPKAREVLHWARGVQEPVRLMEIGTLHLDPPGIALDIAGFWNPRPAQAL